MATCEMCGNDYDGAFTITMAGEEHGRVFDSFECAVHALAPTCSHCGCRIVGHGVQEGGTVFCCAHCAREGGRGAVKDRA